MITLPIFFLWYLYFVNYPLYTGRMVYGNFSTYNHLLSSKMLYTWINLMDEICPSLFKLMVKFVWVLNMSWHFWHLHYIGRKTDSWWWSFVIYWIYVKSQKGKIIKPLLLVTLCKYSWCKSLLGICNWLLHSSYSYPLGIPHFGASIMLLE